jgi:beta-glucosidase
MSNCILRFPAGFLWGAATAAHQNEGNNTGNDFWAWEQDPAHIADHTTSGLACDWWQRAEEDFDRAAALGLNTLRLSVEWSRLEPRPGVWDSAAFDRYRAMLRGLQERGMAPMVTLHHFTNPLWLAERGGWTNEEVVAMFERFTAKVVEALGDLCQTWCTINEPGIYAAEAYVMGRWSPGESDLLKFIRVTRNQFKAHAAAYQAIRRRQGGGQAGLVQHMAAFEPANPASAADRLAASVRSGLLNWRFVEAVIEGRLKFPYGCGLRPYAPAVNSSDFIGLNYYGRHPLRFDLSAGGSLFASPVLGRPEVAWPPPWIARFTRMACSISSSSWPAMASLSTSPKTAWLPPPPTTRSAPASFSPTWQRSSAPSAKGQTCAATIIGRWWTTTNGSRAGPLPSG